MSPTEIKTYKQLQANIKLKKEELESIQLSLQLANEDLKSAEMTLAKTEITVGLDVFLQTTDALNARIAAINQAINENPEQRTELEAEKSQLEQELDQVVTDFSVHQETLDQANSYKNEKENNVNQLVQNQEVISGELDELLITYEPMSDPRTLVEAINDDTPFLLFPVRLETRFMTLKHVRKVNDLSEVQIEETENGGTINSEVSSLKALTVVPKIVPDSTEVIEDKHELWVRIIPDDIAVHTHELRLTQDEFEVGKNYWLEVLADLGDDDLRLAAWRVVVNSYSAERAAWIIKKTEPTNLGTNPNPPDAIFPTLALKPGTWTDQPTSKIMPDRFVARVYTDDTNYREITGNLIPDPLPVGMNPSSADLDTSFDQVDTIVEFPDELKWMTDFEAAEEIGMGIRIPLQGDERLDGFEKMLVLGLKLSEDKESSRQLVEELFDNHHYTNGFSLLPQGTPTNNTEDARSGYNGREIGHEESAATELEAPLFSVESDRFNKADGQWFSELLGVSYSTLEHVRFANRYDQQEGMAMNAALWPATMGYYMKQMLSPLLLNKTQFDISKFYCENVIARGRVPSFRVDNQPYGVLTTSAFSKWKFSSEYETQHPAVTNMVEKVLQPLDAEYDRLTDNVIHSQSTGDVQDNFLKMLGLHASSVEYHQRFASGQFFSWNLLKYFQNTPNETPPETSFPEMDNSIPDAIKTIYNSSVGFNFNITPRILQLLFVREQRLLDGPLIDMEVLPLSETRTTQPFPETDMNYIEWLFVSDFNQIKAEYFGNITGILEGQKPPKALLYLLLRHACLLQYINTALQILEDQQIVEHEAQLEFELQKEVDDVEMSTEEVEMLTNLVAAEVTYEYELQGGRDQEELQKMINTELATRKDKYRVEVSKWDYLTQVHEDVTGGKTLLQFILDDLEISGPHTECLQKIKSALDVLKDVPTARLERCMAESLDTCNYRLDAWMLGMVNERLESQAKNNLANDNQGSFIGSFGMLEGLTPNVSFPGIHIVEIDDTNGGESTDFVYVGTDRNTELGYDDELGKVVSPPRVNDQNLGFIHGPSVNHAVAAAILRAGYAGHQGTASPDSALAVNLRSDRVRKALFYLEGVQNGQDLAGLLGYQFERSLHDIDAGLDQYILDIRRQFPLVANGLVADEPSEGSIEAFEARNVVDGLQLIEEYRSNPTGWDSGISPSIPTAERNLIIASIDKIVDHMDAIGDLMLSEGMFQVATGNHERAGAVIKALGEGNVIPDPQIIKTPRLDKVYMQRKALLFDTVNGNSQAWSGNESARSFSEPALNNWLKTVLPDPNNVLINYQYTTLDLLGDEVITDAQMVLSDLGLQPIDFIYMLTDQGSSEDGTQLSALMNYVAIHTISNTEIPISIKFIDRTNITLPEQITIFELLPLVRSIQEMISQGRVAKPEDFLLEGEVYAVEEAALPTQGMDLSNIEARLTEAMGPATTAGRKGLVDIKSDLENAMNDADAIVDITGNEALLDVLRDALLMTSQFATQGSVPEVAYDYSIEVRNTLSAQASRILIQLISIETKTANGFTELAGITDLSDRLDKLQEIAEFLFGRGFKVFPEFIFYNQGSIDQSRSNNSDLLSLAGDFAIDEWLHGVSKVRSKMSNYHLFSMLGETLSDTLANKEVIQFPIVSNIDDKWLSTELPAGYAMPDEAISLVLDLPDTYSTSALQAGLILDEWTESIPEPNAITGIAFNYDQPNIEAPNTLLLAVTPEETGAWLWNDLMDTLNETLSMAKKRAIDPDILNAHSPLGHALPALVAAIEAGDTAPGLDFSRNIVDAESGQVGPISVQAYTTAPSE